MTVLNLPNPAELEGRMAYDDAGRPVGLIEGVYLDNETQRPKWAAVRIDENGALVPLEGAVPTPDGVKIMFPKDLVVEAPCRQPDLILELSHDTEELLYRYYGDARRRAEGTDGAATDDATREQGTLQRSRHENESEVLSVVRHESAKVADRASEVTEVVKEKAGTVFQIARRQTGDVVEEAQSQAREVIHGARSQVTGQADAQVQQIARGLQQLAMQARALAEGNRAAAGPLADVVGRAGQELITAAGDMQAKGAGGLLSDCGRVARNRPAPVAIGAAAALIAGSRLLKTPVGTRVKEAVAPRLKEGVTAAGRTVTEELRPLADQRIARVKDAAVDAADRLSNQAQGVARDVRTQSKRSAKTVKGTTKASARRVKQAAAS